MKIQVINAIVGPDINLQPGVYDADGIPGLHKDRLKSLLEGGHVKPHREAHVEQATAEKAAESADEKAADSKKGGKAARS